MARHDQAKQQRSRFETLLEGRNSVSFEFSSWRGAATHAAQLETLAKTDRNENRRQPKSGVRRYPKNNVAYPLLFPLPLRSSSFSSLSSRSFVFVLIFVFVVLFVFLFIIGRTLPPRIYQLEFIGSKIFVIMFVSNVFWQPWIRRYYNVDRGIACDVAIRRRIKISISIFADYLYLDFLEQVSGRSSELIQLLEFV